MKAEADIDRKTFLWGVVLAWVPIAFFMVGIVRAFMQVSAQKTSGWVAVAGDFLGVLVTYALLIGFASPILAIVLLIRVIRQTRSATRTFVAVISLCGAAMVLLMCGAALWSVARLHH